MSQEVSDAAKLAGWKNLQALADHRDVSTETLRRWYKSKRHLFDAAAGAKYGASQKAAN